MSMYLKLSMSKQHSYGLGILSWDGEGGGGALTSKAILDFSFAACVSKHYCTLQYLIAYTKLLYIHTDEW